MCQAFIAQSAPSFGYFLLTYMTGFVGRNTYLCVAVTDEAIYVLESSKWSGGAKPHSLLGQMPRATRLGPVSGRRWTRIELFGQRSNWVHRRFFAQIVAADRDAGF